MGQSPTYMVKVIIPSLYISVVELFRVLIWEEKKVLPALLSDRCVTSLDSSTSSQQGATLLAGDSCSGISSVPPLTFLPPLAIHQNTSESGTKSMLPLLLIPLELFSSAPNSRYSSLRETYCRWIPGSMCYQSESLPLSPSSLSN